MEEDIVEMLDKALAQQRRSVKAYELMISSVGEAAERRILQTLRREDRRHFYLFEGVYEELCGHEWRRPQLSLALPRHYPAMLQVVLCEKLDMIDYYRRIAAALDCAKQRELVEIVVADQKEQARLLGTLYKQHC